MLQKIKSLFHFNWTENVAPKAYLFNHYGEFARHQAEFDWKIHELCRIQQIVCSELNKQESGIDEFEEKNREQLQIIDKNSPEQIIINKKLAELHCSKLDYLQTNCFLALLTLHSLSTVCEQF